MDPEVLLAISGGLGTVLGTLGTLLGRWLKRTTGEAKDVHDLPAMHGRLTALESKWEELEAEAEVDKRVKAAVAEALAERARKDLEDSSPASSQIMTRSGE